jgi:hypothetical protein
MNSGQIAGLHEPDTEAGVLEAQLVQPAVESEPQWANLMLVLPRGDVVERV